MLSWLLSFFTSEVAFLVFK